MKATALLVTNWAHDEKLRELGDSPTRPQLNRVGEKPERKDTSGNTRRGWSEVGLRCYVALLEKVKTECASEQGLDLTKSTRRE